MKLRRKKSARTDGAINKLYAMMASKAAEVAIVRVACGNFDGADAAASYVAKWLELAGAEATRWHFKCGN